MILGTIEGLDTVTIVRVRKNPDANGAGEPRLKFEMLVLDLRGEIHAASDSIGSRPRSSTEASF